ncbi:MAG: diguanylate cyclase, partial [Rhodoferax sp.]|nr:diguanylate cyclase [Rhodoferax sp.]
MAPHAPRFERVAYEELNQVSITNLLQDRLGFIWIATNNGLFRFDGYTLVSFGRTPDTGHSLPSSRIMTLTEDTQGQLWVGTDNGLARLNRDTLDFTTFVPKSGPPKRLNVRAVVPDGANGFWIGTWGGLQRFDPATGEFRLWIHQPDDPSSIADNNVNALVRDVHGGLWVGLWNHGLDYLAPGASGFEHFRIDAIDRPDLQLNTARALHIDRRKQLWIGTENGVVVWPTSGDWSERRRLPDTRDFARPRVFSIVEDEDDTLWFGSITQGLAKWDNERREFTAFSPITADPHSIGGRAVRSMLVDRQGLLWIGSMADGLSRLNLASRGFDRILPQTITRSVHVKNSVKSIAGAGGTRIWIGSSDGLHALDIATRQSVRSIVAQWQGTDGLSNNTIFSLHHTENGVLWAGTMKGLYAFDATGQMLHRVSFGESAANYIDSISPGTDGRLWLCTGAGLIHYDPATKTIKRYFHDAKDANSRSVTPTSDVLEDDKGNVWMVSGSGGGLDRLDARTGKFTNYRHDGTGVTSPSSDRATRLHKTADGVIWLASANALDRLTVDADGGVRFRSYRMQTLMPSTVQSLQSDTAGNVWLSTSSGLSRFDPVSESFAHFTTADGITGNFLFGASTRHRDGSLFFGGEHGVTQVIPDAVRIARTPPAVAITDVMILNKSLRGGANYDGRVALTGSILDPRALKMSWREPVFSIAFAALQFDAPSTLRYAYKLEGFDSDWVTADASHRVATYTNLDPGAYTFRVRATNRYEISDDIGIAFPIEITPPFWRTIWFQVLCALALVSTVSLLHRWRVRWLVRNQLALKSLVAERTMALEQSNAALKRLSATDGLTGLSNRRVFDEVLLSEWNRGKRSGHALTVAMIDVDLFKKYNDHYGHQAGDACLRQVAQAIAACIRRSDDLVARYGGEEFVLVLPSLDGVQAFNVAASVRQAIEVMALPH